MKDIVFYSCLLVWFLVFALGFSFTKAYIDFKRKSDVARPKHDMGWIEIENNLGELFTCWFFWPLFLGGMVAYIVFFKLPYMLATILIVGVCQMDKKHFLT